MTRRDEPERHPWPFTIEEIDRDVYPALHDLREKIAEAIRTHDQVIAALKAGQSVPMFATGPRAVFGAEGLRSDFVLRHKRLTDLIYRCVNAAYSDGEDDAPDLCTVQVPVWNSTRPRMEPCGMELDCPTHGPAREGRPEAAAPAAG